MIIVNRHENLDNWFEVRFHGKLIEQFTSRIKAYQFAQSQAAKKKSNVYDLDKGLKIIGKK